MSSSDVRIRVHGHGAARREIEPSPTPGERQESHPDLKGPPRSRPQKGLRCILYSTLQYSPRTQSTHYSQIIQKGRHPRGSVKCESPASISVSLRTYIYVDIPRHSVRVCAYINNIYVLSHPSHTQHHQQRICVAPLTQYAEPNPAESTQHTVQNETKMTTEVL